jgi:hypothetical protein
MRGGIGGRSWRITVRLVSYPPSRIGVGLDKLLIFGWERTDFELDRLLETLDGDYTVFMFSDPNEFKAYEPEFIEAVHVDLKRWAEEDEMVAKRKSNSTSNLPLFEKYQFFTPGEFSFSCESTPGAVVH